MRFLATHVLHRTRLHPSVTFAALYLLQRLKVRFLASPPSSYSPLSSATASLLSTRPCCLHPHHHTLILSLAQPRPASLSPLPSSLSLWLSLPSLPSLSLSPLLATLSLYPSLVSPPSFCHGPWPHRSLTTTLARYVRDPLGPVVCSPLDSPPLWPSRPLTSLFIPLLTPRYLQDFSLSLNLTHVIGIAANTSCCARAWTHQGRFGMADPSPVEAPVIPHGHASISTSVKPKTVALVVTPSATPVLPTHTPPRSPDTSLGLDLTSVVSSASNASRCIQT